MTTYTHKVNYYETDIMGITHHSNYIRFMEEARMQYLTEIGYPMKRIEEEGITSPVVAVSCDYKQPTTYDDEIEIVVAVSSYNGVKLCLSYTMTNKASGALVATATSSHCFIDAVNRRPVSVKKSYPDLDTVLKAQLA